MRFMAGASARAASLALVLCLLGALMSVAGFVTNQAGRHVAQATELHDGIESARFGLSQAMAHAHAFIATREPEAHAAFYATTTEVSAALARVRESRDPTMQSAAVDLLLAHQDFMAAAIDDSAT